MCVCVCVYARRLDTKKGRNKKNKKKMEGSIEEGIVVDGTPFFPNHRVRA